MNSAEMDGTSCTWRDGTDGNAPARAPFHERSGRASSFAQATKDKDTLPSHGSDEFVTSALAEQALGPSTFPTYFSQDALPSILLRQGYGGQGRPDLPWAFRT